MPFSIHFETLADSLACTRYTRRVVYSHGSPLLRRTSRASAMKMIIKITIAASTINRMVNADSGECGDVWLGLGDVWLGLGDVWLGLGDGGAAWQSASNAFGASGQAIKSDG